MNRPDLQKLAMIRLGEAEALLALGRPCGAIYLAGYSIECALKACIAKLVREHDFPDRRLAERAWKHKLPDLLELSGLAAILENDRKLNRRLDTNWSLVKDWTEEIRYDHNISLARAQEFVQAVNDKNEGVLAWLQVHW